MGGDPAAAEDPEVVSRINQLGGVILGGLSWNALARGAQTSSSDPDDLTYDPQGGLGLWPGPIIDAHFRERGRQGRLEQLGHWSGRRYREGVLASQLHMPSSWGIRRSLG